jgi:shikimate dehydrogenase
VAVLRTGLIGMHISRTRLPAALQIMCDHTGLELEFEAIDTAYLPGFDLAANLERLRRDGWTSVSVTHPFKAAARDWVGDGMDAEIAHLMSCNTVVFGSLATGYNTDYTGFVGAWRTGLGVLPPGHVTMAGAGGVAQAIGPALATLGAKSIGLYDPDAARTKALAGAIGSSSMALSANDLRSAIARSDGLVNATPLGMVEHPGAAFDPE